MILSNFILSIRTILRIKRFKRFILLSQIGVSPLTVLANSQSYSHAHSQTDSQAYSQTHPPTVRLKSEVVLPTLFRADLTAVPLSQLIEEIADKHSELVPLFMRKTLDLRGLVQNLSAPSDILVVRGEDVARLIRQSLQNQDQNRRQAQFILFAPKEIVVTSTRQNLRRQWLERLQSEYLKICPECQIEIDLERFPEGVNPQKISIPVQALRWNQNFSVVTSAGPLVGKTRALKPQFVLRSPITQGEKINESLLTVELRPYNTGMKSLQVSRLPFLVARRALSAGTVITDSDLQPEILVRRGDPVKVVVGGAGFQVQIDGVSESQGGMGDTVQVRNPQTKRLLSGVVAEKGKVRLQ